jgi:hypothetical protein
LKELIWNFAYRPRTNIPQLAPLAIFFAFGDDGKEDMVIAVELQNLVDAIEKPNKKSKLHHVRWAEFLLGRP